jgi:hypothetical protein
MAAVTPDHLTGALKSAEFCGFAAAVKENCKKYLTMLEPGHRSHSTDAVLLFQPLASVATSDGHQVPR